MHEHAPTYDQFTELIDALSRTLAEGFVADLRHLNELEHAREGCQCARCTKAANDFLRVMNEKWNIPDEERDEVERVLEEHVGETPQF